MLWIAFTFILSNSSHSGDDVLLTPSCMHSGEGESDVSTPTIIHSTKDIQPQKELQNIISQLEEENRRVQQTVEQLSGKEDTSDMCERLRYHYIHVGTQVQRLKLLKYYLLERSPYQLEHLQSTPLLSATQQYRETSCFEDISPITKETEDNKQLAGMRELQLLTWQMKNDRQTNESDSDETTVEVNNVISTVLPSVSDVSVRDLSTWVAGRTLDRAEDKDPSTFSTWVPECCHSDPKQKLKELHGDLDATLQKLQEILASNFLLEESFSSRDNTQLQQGAQEVEDLITGLIRSVESQKTS
ncbi:hypothetical protein B7P43_G12764 [Cryptotermes secundus]|uniref:Uncharacterized protein n=1 Tax=Cryptotermes secundus TaxID=105785 RepID=A0A2J7R5J9_9NEOP|nr:hypothetical protein B7P43_G12764 [Cryptotermes secundus]